MEPGPAASPAAPPASLLVGGRRLLLTEPVLTIGRSEENDLAVADERASRRHARIYLDHGDYWVADLGSRHGTVHNGERLRSAARRLANGDAIEIGAERLRFLRGDETRMASREVPVTETHTVVFDGTRLAIGRDAHNDVVLPHPNISRFHAEVVRRDGKLELRDLGSRNGIRLNGKAIERATLEPGADIGIGPYRLVFDGTTFLARSEKGALRLDAEAISVEVGGKRILSDASVSLEPGELVAIIGESGAGKTTLLKAIAGVNPHISGRVTVNGEPVGARLSDIAYVPQDEIVHELLSVREALGYAARLRLPQDATEEELAGSIDRVLSELALDEHGGTRIGSLSGGQRKRTGVATELLGEPGVLCLDEPTTGMDPGLESRMMELFRTLADNSRAVAVTTHATRNLAMCDRIVVMARGGYVVFDGPPAEGLKFFGVEEYDQIYIALEETPAEEWLKKHGAPERPPEAAAEPVEHEAPSRHGRGFFGQTAVLVSRYVKLITRDRRNLLLLIGQAPILALLGVSLFEANVFARPGGDPARGIQVAFLAVVVIIWLGSIDSAREIVKERAVVAREAAIGTRLSAYLASKVIVLFAIIAIQVLLYAGLLFAFRPLHAPASAWIGVFSLLLVTGFVAVCTGLLVSALSHTEDQSLSFIPLAMIPQLLFAGTMVPVSKMAAPAKVLSDVIFARWSLASVGHAIDMNSRIRADKAFARLNDYGYDFFTMPTARGLLILVAFMVAFLSLVAVLLRRRLRD